VIFSSLIRATLQQGRFAVPVILFFVLAGCGREEIKVYRVAKEKPETPVVANPQSNQRVGELSESAPAKPVWTLPAGWTEEPPSQMSLAKFSVGGQDARAQITVSAFPGDVGGLLANVNRWRGQVNLPPISEADLPNAVARFETKAGNADLVELAGTNAMAGRTARLICVVLRRGGQTWFFKIMGDKTVVAREKDAFLKFVQSAKLPDAP
jgi:hypothetical protein